MTDFSASLDQSDDSAQTDFGAFRFCPSAHVVSKKPCTITGGSSEVCAVGRAGNYPGVAQIIKGRAPRPGLCT